MLEKKGGEENECETKCGSLPLLVQSNKGESIESDAFNMFYVQ